MASSTVITELICSVATMLVSGVLFRFLATGGPRFTIIGDLDPAVLDKAFEILMWLCGAIVIFQMFHIVTLVLSG